MNGFLNRRIAIAVLANGYVRGMRVVEQLILVPMLLAAWGLDRFGEWLALSSLAAFAAIANLGIGHAAASDIVIQHASGSIRNAARSFFTAMVLTALLVGVAFGLLLLAMIMIDFGAILQLHTVTRQDAGTVMVLLGLAVLLSFFVEPFFGVIAASSGAGLPNFIQGAIKTLEIIVIGIALVMGAQPVSVALIAMLAGLTTLAVLAGAAFKLADWLSFGPGSFDRSAIGRLWRPAIGHYCLYVAINILNVHLTRLVVLHALGAAALSAFTIFVTYTRMARLVAYTLSHGAQVEIGRTFASGLQDQAASIIRTVVVRTVAISLAVLVIEILLAPIIIPSWTNGQVGLHWSLLGALALVALIGTYFDGLLAAATALNRVALIALSYTAGLAIGLGIAALVLPIVGLVGAAICMLGSEVAGAWAATRTINQLIGERKLTLGGLWPWRSDQSGRPALSGPQEPA